MTDAIGWASSILLLLTILTQIRKQWQAGTSKGVSKWLFVGQIAASAGFAIYSILVGNWVFIITNTLMALSAIVGLGIVLHQQKKGAG